MSCSLFSVLLGLLLGMDLVTGCKRKLMHRGASALRLSFIAIALESEAACFCLLIIFVVLVGRSSVSLLRAAVSCSQELVIGCVFY